MSVAFALADLTGSRATTTPSEHTLHRDLIRVAANVSR